MSAHLQPVWGVLQQVGSRCCWRLLLAGLSAVGACVVAWNKVERRRFARWKNEHFGKDYAAVSIIVPALNEEAQIASQVLHLRSLQPQAAEIIVVDGGSNDRTALEASGSGAKVLSSKRGRAKQMNVGGMAATGGILCFVHADTLPPKDLVDIVRYELSNPAHVAGGILTRITFGGRLLLWMTFHHFIKTYYMPLLLRPWGFFNGLRCLLGDQTLFMRKADFLCVDGFREDLPIMEDADLTIRLHEKGCYLAPGKRAAVRHVLYRSQETSGRRMVNWGTLYATWIHFYFGLTWYFGRSGSQEKLQKMYRELYGDCAR